MFPNKGLRTKDSVPKYFAMFILAPFSCRLFCVSLFQLRAGSWSQQSNSNSYPSTPAIFQGLILSVISNATCYPVSHSQQQQKTTWIPHLRYVNIASNNFGFILASLFQWLGNQKYLFWGNLSLIWKGFFFAPLSSWKGFALVYANFNFFMGTSALLKTDKFTMCEKCHAIVSPFQEKSGKRFALTYLNFQKCTVFFCTFEDK